MAKKQAQEVKVQVPVDEKVESGMEVQELTVKAENVNIETPRNGEPGAAKAMMEGDEQMPADIKAVMDANKTEGVVTGKDIRDGSDIVKQRPVKPAEKDYSAGRKLYPVHTAVDGSYNGRKISLKKGESIHLNDAELAVFRSYVGEAQ